MLAPSCERLGTDSDLAGARALHAAGWELRVRDVLWARAESIRAVLPLARSGALQKQWERLSVHSGTRNEPVDAFSGLFTLTEPGEGWRRSLSWEVASVVPSPSRATRVWTARALSRGSKLPFAVTDHVRGWATQTLLDHSPASVVLGDDPHLVIASRVLNTVLSRPDTQR